MGTNYYIVKNGPSIKSPVHIGKSSAGWLFLFQTQNEKYDNPHIVWNTYKQVNEWLYEHTVLNPEYAIVNEYDEIIPFADFIDLIQDKQNDPDCRGNPDNFHHSKNVDNYRFCDEEFS